MSFESHSTSVSLRNIKNVIVMKKGRWDSASGELSFHLTGADGEWVVVTTLAPVLLMKGFDGHGGLLSKQGWRPSRLFLRMTIVCDGRT